MSNETLVLDWKGIDRSVRNAISDIKLKHGILNSIAGNPDKNFTKYAEKLMDKSLHKMIDPDKVRRWFPENAKLWNLANSLREVCRDFGILAHATMLSACNQAALILGEALAPLTEEFFERPKHPYRDHVAHVMAVLCIGWYLLNNQHDHGDSPFDRLVNAVRESDTIKWIEQLCGGKDEYDDDTIRSIIALAWIMAAFCHDMTYGEEIQSWLESLSFIAEFIERSSHKESHRKAITKMRLTKAIKVLAKNNENLQKYLVKSLIKMIRNKKDMPMIGQKYCYYDHGQIAAALLLDYFTENKNLEKLNEGQDNKNIALPAILLASFAIFDHDRFTADKDELYNKNYKSRAEHYWKRNPLGVFLAISDLLAEGLRVSWKVFHYPENILKHLNENQMKMELHNFIGIPLMELDCVTNSPDCVVKYQVFKKVYRVKNLKPSGDNPWTAWQAIYEQEKIPNTLKKRMKDYKATKNLTSLTKKEQRINSFWQNLSKGSLIYLDHKLYRKNKSNFAHIEY